MYFDRFDICGAYLARTRHRGRYITGYFTGREDGTVFVPHAKHAEFLGAQKC